MVKVIASNVRKGNVIEHEDSQLYVVLKADSFRPGKGTPTTTVEMRRISDGVKTQITVKTTESLERAFVEEVRHNYLYHDGDNFIFINNENYEQNHRSRSADRRPGAMAARERRMRAADVRRQAGVDHPAAAGDDGHYRHRTRHQGPDRIVVVQAGDRPTAAPASWCRRTSMSGRGIVINTEDGSYVERAKD